MTTRYAKSSVMQIIRSKYKILEVIDLFIFDDVRYNIDDLEKNIAKYQQYEFQHNQRIVVLHHDTDYYINCHTPGFMLHNLVTLIKKYNIPQEFFILLTNHYGCQRDIDKLNNNIEDNLSMKVIYTSQWFDFPNEFAHEIKLQPIEKLYTCLNGVQRIHRTFTLALLQETQLLEHGIISYHFAK